MPMTNEQNKQMINDLIQGFSENVEELNELIKKSQVMTANNHVVYNAEVSAFVEVDTDKDGRMIDANAILNPKYLKTHLTKEDALKVQDSLSAKKGEYKAWNFIDALNHQKSYYQERIDRLKTELEEIENSEPQ
jgi:hypothetical protein